VSKVLGIGHINDMMVNVLVFCRSDKATGRTSEQLGDISAK